jgi:hypothetical protein
MRIWRLALFGLLCVAGCQGVIGPFQRRSPERVDDPAFTIPQQEYRGRARLPLWNDRTDLAPKTYADRPDPVWR